MTSREMVAEFQRLVIQSDPTFFTSNRMDVYFIYQFLNTAQNLIFKERYIPSSIALENIIIISRNIEEVKHLIKTSEAYYNGLENSIVENESYKKSFLVECKVNDYAHYINSFTELEREQVFPSEENDTILVENNLITHNDVNRYLTTSIHTPIIRKPGILINTYSNSSIKLTLLVDKYTTKVYKVKLNYLMYPPEIDDTNNCILDKSLHKIVVNQAVQLFRSNKYILSSTDGNEQKPQQ